MTSFRKGWVWVLVIVIAMSGILFSSWIAKRSDRQLRENLLLRIQIIADSVDQNDVKALSFTLNDRTNPSFMKLEDWMKKLAKDIGCRSLYSVVQKGSTIIFGPENLQVNDPDASPPGTIYKNPPEKLRSVFLTCKAITVGPYRDEYGTFVSAFSPVIDPITGKAILVIGMDVEAADWKWDVISDAALPMSLTFLLVFLLIFYVYLQKSHMVLNAREISLRESEKKHRHLFESMVQGVVYQVSDGRIIDANPAAERILRCNLDQLKGNTSLDPNWEAIHEDGSPYPGETHPAMIVMQTGKPVLNSIMGIKNQQEVTYKWIEIDAVPQFQPGEDKPYQVYTTFEDITERRQAEEALRESERHLSDIIEFLPDATLVIDKQGRITAWNKAIENMTGYSPSDMIGKGDYEYAIPFYGERRPILIDLVLMPKEEVEKIYYNIMRKGDLLIGETDVPVVKGEKRFLSGWAHPIYDFSGQVIGAIECIRDITDKRRAEEALAESEEKYRAIFENATEGIYQSTPEGRYLSVNPAFARMSGFGSPQEMIDSVKDIGQELYVNPADRQEMVRLLREYDKVEGYEVEIFRRDRTRFWISINVHVVHDTQGNILYFEGTNTDITERKLAEEALRKSEEKYRILGENVRDVIWFFDINLGYTFVTPSVQQLRGYTAEEALKQTMDQILTPESYQKAKTILDRELTLELSGHRHGPNWSFTSELEMIRKDGSTVWTEATMNIVYNKNGEPSGIMGVTRDITERKHAEEALRSSEKKYRELIQNIQAAVVVHGVDTQIQTCNRQAQELLGLTEEQILGKQVIDPDWHFFLENGTAMPLEEYPVMRVLATRKPFWNAVMGVHRSTKKEDVWVLVSAFPVSDENSELAQIVVTFVDITDRRRAEEDLQKTNQALQAIIDASPLAIFTLDHDLRVTSWSPAAERIFGWSKKEAIGQYNPIVPEEKWGEFKALISKVLSGSGYSNSEVMRQTKDGRAIYVNVSTEPLRDSSGKVVGAMGVIQDITERKRAEKEKDRLEAQLTQAQKMESIGTLAGGIAHDFNNILSAIIGYSELAIEDVSEPQKAKREIKEVLKAADRAKELAKHILTFSRKTDVEYSPIALRTVVKDSIKMLRSVIPTTIDIQQDLTDSGLIMSNPTQINQILLNLCTNASHAMDKTGGVLKISLKRVNINKETEAHELNLHLGNYLILSVSDTGHGIPSEILDRIFEPYFTTKEMGRGTGLGLSVVHGIVISHGGNIICKSTPGKGTSFEIFLPEIESMKEVVTHEEEETIPTGKEHILFVDDEPVLVNLAEKMLSKLGYTIETRTSSVEALKLFQDSPDKYDLIITDMTMPGMTGDRLAQKFMEIRHDIPIILCSGYSEHISKEKTEKIGIREFVMKPIEMKVLAKTIRRVLDGW